MNYKTLRTLIGSLSFTTALFVFQACYGTPQAVGNDFLVEGCVTSRSTGEPVQHMRVGIDGESQHQYTDAEGKFSFYTVKRSDLRLVVEDIDNTDNGNYNAADTLIAADGNRIYLDISVNPK